ncbi:MAG: cyclodeaminase/cyclohydrolase family protein [Dehalobacterium sp.]|jgi:formiminotetrahydrofolate cyclodeaminase
MLIKKSLEEFNQILGSDAPAPGGGSVAALSGSLAGELISMVCSLSIGRKAQEPYQELLTSTQSKVKELSAALLVRVDTDTEAFQQVMAAFKLPKGNDEEIELRKSAIQAGYKEAVKSPMGTAEQCLEVLQLAEKLKGKFNENAMSDFGVAALMAWAGLEGAIMNVRINLPSIKDENYVSSKEDEVNFMLQEGNKIKDEIYKYVSENLA